LEEGFGVKGCANRHLEAQTFRSFPIAVAIEIAVDPGASKQFPGQGKEPISLAAIAAAAGTDLGISSRSHDLQLRRKSRPGDSAQATFHTLSGAVGSEFGIRDSLLVAIAPGTSDTQKAHPSSPSPVQVDLPITVGHGAA